MKIENYKNYALSRIEKNFDKLNPMMSWNPKVFFEIHMLIIENLKCLMLDANIASITMNNYILERLLKLALINNESLGKDDEAAIRAHKKYDGTQLSANIKSCLDLELIDESDFQKLSKFININMRHGFSHAQTDLILQGIPDEIPMFQTKSSDDSELQQVTMNRKVFSVVTQIQIESFAQKNSLNYLKFISILSRKLDNKIYENMQINQKY